MQVVSMFGFEVNSHHIVSPILFPTFPTSYLMVPHRKCVTPLIHPLSLLGELRPGRRGRAWRGHDRLCGCLATMRWGRGRPGEWRGASQLWPACVLVIKLDTTKGRTLRWLGCVGWVLVAVDIFLGCVRGYWRGWMFVSRKRRWNMFLLMVSGGRLQNVPETSWVKIWRMTKKPSCYGYGFSSYHWRIVGCKCLTAMALMISSPPTKQRG